jgi:hypothetical protein
MDNGYFVFIDYISVYKLNIWKSWSTHMEIEDKNLIHLFCYIIPYIGVSDHLVKNFIQQDGLLIKFVPKASTELKMIAACQNGFSVYYDITGNEDVAMLATAQNGLALQYVKNQTEKVIKSALIQNPSSYKYIINPTKEHLDLATYREKQLELERQKQIDSERQKKLLVMNRLAQQRRSNCIIC